MISDDVFVESKLQQVLVCNNLRVTSLLALVKSSQAMLLRLLPPSAVHFKIRVSTFAPALWDLLAAAGLGLNSSDVGAGFLRGKGLSCSWFRI